MNDDALRVVCLLRPTSKRNKICKIFVPDFNVKVYGKDYVEALANAISTCSAVYYYNLERNYEIKLRTTYEQACDMVRYKDEVVTWIKLVP